MKDSAYVLNKQTFVKCLSTVLQLLQYLIHAYTDPRKFQFCSGSLEYML